MPAVLHTRPDTWVNMTHKLRKRNFMELGARLIYMMATSTVLKDIFFYKKDPSTFILIAIKLFQRLDGRT